MELDLTAISSLISYIKVWQGKKIHEALLAKGYISKDESAKSVVSRYKITTTKHDFSETYFIDGVPFLKISIVGMDNSPENELQMPKYVAEIL